MAHRQTWFFKFVHLNFRWRNIFIILTKNTSIYINNDRRDYKSTVWFSFQVVQNMASMPYNRTKIPTKPSIFLNLLTKQSCKCLLLDLICYLVINVCQLILQVGSNCRKIRVLSQCLG